MSENQSVELEVSSSIYFLLMSHSSIASESAGLDILRSVATFEASKRRKSQFKQLSSSCMCTIMYA